MNLKHILMQALTWGAPVNINGFQKRDTDCIPIATTSFDTEPAPCQPTSIPKAESSIISKNEGRPIPITASEPVVNSDRESKNQSDESGPKLQISSVSFINESDDSAGVSKYDGITAGSGNLGKL